MRTSRLIAGVMVGALLLTGGLPDLAWGAAPKTIQSSKTKDVVITLLSESGQWNKGKNSFVLEFISPTNKQPVDAGKVTLSTSMAMPGMPTMIASASLDPDKTPGRYLGTISFQDNGTRQVTITWDGPAGKGSIRLSVPVH